MGTSLSDGCVGPRACGKYNPLGVPDPGIEPRPRRVDCLGVGLLSQAEDEPVRNKEGSVHLRASYRYHRVCSAPRLLTDDHSPPIFSWARERESGDGPAGSVLVSPYWHSSGFTIACGVSLTVLLYVAGMATSI
jgi:hypothetical protein